MTYRFENGAEYVPEKVIKRVEAIGAALTVIWLAFVCGTIVGALVIPRIAHVQQGSDLMAGKIVNVPLAHCYRDLASGPDVWGFRHCAPDEPGDLGFKENSK